MSITQKYIKHGEECDRLVFNDCLGVSGVVSHTFVSENVFRPDPPMRTDLE